VRDPSDALRHEPQRTGRQHHGWWQSRLFTKVSVVHREAGERPGGSASILRLESRRVTRDQSREGDEARRDARGRRPRRADAGVGMYQSGRRPGWCRTAPSHATASPSSGACGSAARASSVSSSSEKGADAPPLVVVSGRSTIASPFSSIVGADRPSRSFGSLGPLPLETRRGSSRRRSRPSCAGQRGRAARVVAPSHRAGPVGSSTSRAIVTARPGRAGCAGGRVPRPRARRRRRR
jgi:hypothetical protein